MLKLSTTHTNIIVNSRKNYILFLLIFIPGHWGGIWSAPRGYSFLATDNRQTNVDLRKKFDDWEYKYAGIEKRMPYLCEERLTLAADPKNNIYASITGMSFIQNI
jgi:hypothetical protein